jgi:hypothetical protein
MVGRLEVNDLKAEILSEKFSSVPNVTGRETQPMG